MTNAATPITSDNDNNVYSLAHNASDASLTNETLSTSADALILAVANSESDRAGASMRLVNTLLNLLTLKAITVDGRNAITQAHLREFVLKGDKELKLVNSIMQATEHGKQVLSAAAKKPDKIADIALDQASKAAFTQARARKRAVEACIRRALLAAYNVKYALQSEFLAWFKRYKESYEQYCTERGTTPVSLNSADYKCIYNHLLNTDGTLEVGVRFSGLDYKLNEDTIIEMRRYTHNLSSALKITNDKPSRKPTPPAPKDDDNKSKDSAPVSNWEQLESAVESMSFDVNGNSKIRAAGSKNKAIVACATMTNAGSLDADVISCASEIQQKYMESLGTDHEVDLKGKSLDKYIVSEAKAMAKDIAAQHKSQLDELAKLRREVEQLRTLLKDNGITLPASK